MSSSSTDNGTGINLNGTGLILKHFYKVPNGFEPPHAGRWLKVVGHNKGAINFHTASGKFLSLGNASSELLAKHNDGERITTPKTWR